MISKERLNWLILKNATIRSSQNGFAKIIKLDNQYRVIDHTASGGKVWLCNGRKGFNFELHEVNTLEEIRKTKRLSTWLEIVQER